MIISNRNPATLFHQLLTIALVISTTLLLDGCGDDKATAPDDTTAAYIQEVAERFAPLLRFDQKQGEPNKCFPGDAGEYYEARKVGNQSRICNTSYSSIQNAEIPIYYQYAGCKPDTEYVMYWFFYGWQDYCSPGSGEHNADWERICVKIVNQSLDRVMFFQHEGQYTRVRGNYEVFQSTHPVVYVGKNSHGSYHDDGGTGTCCYFEDFRNPGSKNQYMSTWLNLIRLFQDSDAPEWMKYDGVTYWDGLEGPLHRDQDNDLCHLQGCRGAWTQVCHTCGCAKSNIGDSEM